MSITDEFRLTSLALDMADAIEEYRSFRTNTKTYIGGSYIDELEMRRQAMYMACDNFTNWRKSDNANGD